MKKEKARCSIATVFSVILALVAIVVGSLLIYKSNEINSKVKTKANTVKGSRKDIKVSLIIPVYKAEKYLEECLKSVQKQTLDAIECICVDDGSPDNCGKILDQYAKKDSRFKVIHQKNSGVSAARNAGIDASSGEYIKFLDADDTIEPRTCETCYKKAKKYDSDIVISDMGYDAVLDAPVFEILTETSWRCVFRRNFINGNNIKFKTDLKFAEDQTFNLFAFTRANKIVVIKDQFYNYRQHLESACHTAKLDVHSTCHSKAAKYVYDDWKRRGFFKNDNVKAKFLTWWLNLNYWPENKSINKKFVDAVGKEIFEEKVISLLSKDLKSKAKKILLSVNS